MQFKRVLVLIAILFIIQETDVKGQKDTESIKNVGQGALDKIPEDTKPFFYADKKDVKWFEDAKFGLFICWGPCSIVATEIRPPANPVNRGESVGRLVFQSRFPYPPARSRRIAAKTD